jgi:hypothetical protein
MNVEFATLVPFLNARLMRELKVSLQINNKILLVPLLVVNVSPSTGVGPVSSQPARPKDLLRSPGCHERCLANFLDVAHVH